MILCSTCITFSLSIPNFDVCIRLRKFACVLDISKSESSAWVKWLPSWKRSSLLLECNEVSRGLYFLCSQKAWQDNLEYNLCKVYEEKHYAVVGADYPHCHVQTQSQPQNVAIVLSISKHANGSFRQHVLVWLWMPCKTMTIQYQNRHSDDW